MSTELFLVLVLFQFLFVLPRLLIDFTLEFIKARIVTTVKPDAQHNTAARNLINTGACGLDIQIQRLFAENGFASAR